MVENGPHPQPPLPILGEGESVTAKTDLLPLAQSRARVLQLLRVEIPKCDFGSRGVDAPGSGEAYPLSSSGNDGDAISKIDLVQSNISTFHGGKMRKSAPSGRSCPPSTTIVVPVM